MIYEGYKYQAPKGSFFNRFSNKRAVIITIALVFLVFMFFMAYHVGGSLLFNYQESHRLDNLAEEMQAIDYVGRQYLAGERNFMVPKEIIRLDFKDVNGVRYMSCWTDNACYYGPASEFSWRKIEMRED